AAILEELSYLISYGMAVKTVSRHYLDGQLHGEPFTYEGPMARTGNIQVSKLHPGKHTCSMEIYYEFEVEDRTVSGTKKLPEKSFIIEE
ncbi:hypothetical protein ACFL3G_13625, partial [Planctomycetota bacterium]